MDRELAAVADFVQSNRRPLARFMRQKLLAAGAKQYVDGLGKEGIEALDREAAGVLLDLACALLRRLDPDRTIESEEVLAQLPDAIRLGIRLPRSDAYHEILRQLQQDPGFTNG
jgi:hypothetical protein